MRSNKIKCKMLHLGQSSINLCWGVTSTAEKAWGCGRVKRMNMTWKCTLTVQIDKDVLDCIQSIVGNRMREGILLLHSSLVNPHLGYGVQLWEPQHRKNIDLLE